jgi:hypothetical protein
MIISHRKKFVFFANQKTGSKAVGLALRLSGIFDENDIMIAQPFPATRSVAIDLPEYNLGDHKSHIVNHMTPQRAIDAGYITLEQLREYDCYAFLRDPESRYLASRSSMQISRNGNIAMPGRRVSGVAPPQFEFFFVGDEQVVTPLDFDDYEQEIRMLLKKLGGYEHMDVPYIRKILNVHLVHDIKYDPRQHTKDIILHREMKNKCAY